MTAVEQAQAVTAAPAHDRAQVVGLGWAQDNLVVGHQVGIHIEARRGTFSGYDVTLVDGEVRRIA